MFVIIHNLGKKNHETNEINSSFRRSTDLEQREEYARSLKCILLNRKLPRTTLHRVETTVFNKISYSLFDSHLFLIYSPSIRFNVGISFLNPITVEPRLTSSFMRIVLFVYKTRWLPILLSPRALLDATDISCR